VDDLNRKLLVAVNVRDAWELLQEKAEEVGALPLHSNPGVQ
jgi:hypothetical protein